MVVGCGITGLAAAHRALELDSAVELTLLEGSGRLGGVLETARRDGFLLERSADNFITNVPWAVDLCQRIGLADQLLPTSSQQRNAMVVHSGRLEKVPPGFMLMAPSQIWPLLTTPILSPWGKLRLLGEYFVPRRKSGGDESLGEFARRRLGRETFERIVQPLVGGIYTANPEKLSLQATLPRFIEMERRYGSLIRGALREPAKAGDESSDVPDNSDSGARYGLFVTPREGLTSMVEALAARLPTGSIRLNTKVDKITRDPAGTWRIESSSPGSAASLECDALIVAVGAPCAASIVRQFDGEQAGKLSQIPYAGTAIVSLGFHRDQIRHPLDGFGFVVPAIENRRILAGSFSSVKFPGRAPQGAVLVRVFIGGACQSQLIDLPDDELRRIACEELESLLSTTGPPLFADITRWPSSMPQYHLGHCELVAEIERSASRWPGFALAGNAYHGVGIPNCIHSGEEAAERVLAALNAPGPAIASKGTSGQLG